MVQAEIASALDEVAERFQFASDYSSRQAAIDAFRMVCERSGADPALEAAKRNIALLNPFNAT
jgi:hypothetical protein